MKTLAVLVLLIAATSARFLQQKDAPKQIPQYSAYIVSGYINLPYAQIREQ